MADVMLAHGRTCFADAAERSALRRWYRAKRLGRSDGDSLLIEILPYPHPKTSEWLYARFGRFPSRAAYEDALLKPRITLLRGVIERFDRKAIICYGKGKRIFGRHETWERYKLLFPEVQWRRAGAFPGRRVENRTDRLGGPSFIQGFQHRFRIGKSRSRKFLVIMADTRDPARRGARDNVRSALAVVTLLRATNGRSRDRLY